MWNEFKGHFSNPQRQQAQATHHDFLRRHSVQPLHNKHLKLSDEANLLLSQDHRQRSKLHYEKLIKHAVLLPNHKNKHHKLTETMAAKGRHRLDEKADDAAHTAQL